MKSKRIFNNLSLLKRIWQGCCLLLFTFHIGFAQEGEKKEEPIRDIKLLYEYDDGKGHIVTAVQYKQGSMRVKEVIIKPKVIKANIGLKVPIDPNQIDPNSVTLIIDKSDYSLEVRYKDKPIRAYKAVFGPNPLIDKYIEGDRCTPEGVFHISAKNPNSKYTRFLQLNYPTKTVLERFSKLKKEGKIPAHVRAGSDIGIHGIWKGGDDMIEMGIGWTDGCIALKNADIEDLYSLVGVGTKVIIHK